MSLRPALALAVAAMMAGCAAPASRLPGTDTAQTNHPPATIQPFDDAVSSMATALVVNARLDPTEQRMAVVDPPVHRITGDESPMTRKVERRLTEVINERFPSLQASDIDASSLQRRPVLILSCMTPVEAPGADQPSMRSPVQVYRLNASLSDTRTGRVISQEKAWVSAADVDVTPAPFFRDSPGWAPDRSLQAYLKLCAARPGETIDTAFVTGLDASVAAGDGLRAYEAGRYDDALNDYRRASGLPGGEQIRVLNGLYLSNLALGRQHDAAEAFGRIVDAGLEEGTLAVKFVFRPASVQFWPDPAVSNKYPMWLRQIAIRTAMHDTCLAIVGHTSPTGASEANQALSQRRAQFVRRKLVSRAAVLERRTEALGRGSDDPLVGTGRDDASDVLDRRVDFSPHPCATRQPDKVASNSP